MSRRTRGIVVPLTPSAATTRTDFLAVHLQDLKVMQRVELGTGTPSA